MFRKWIFRIRKFFVSIKIRNFKRMFGYIKRNGFKGLGKAIRYNISIAFQPKPGMEYEAYLKNNSYSPKSKIKQKRYVNDKVKFSIITNKPENIELQTYSNYEIISDLKDATGTHIVLIDDNYILREFSLFEILRVIEIRNSDIIYSDNDYTDENGNRYNPDFKSDFSIDTLLAKNYIGNFAVFKKELLEKIEYKSVFEAILKLYPNVDDIYHATRVHYTSLNSKEVHDEEDELRCVNEYFKANSIDAVAQKSEYNFIRKITYTISEENKKKVSIVIPNMDHIDDLDKCIKSILKSSYQNYEIVIVENNSRNEETFKYYEEIKKIDNRIIVEKMEINGFNYSKLVNFGVDHSSGDYIVMLNNDVELLAKNWMEEMIMYVQRDDVGIVGAKLLFADDTVQHAGVTIGIRGLAGHKYYCVPKADFDKYDKINYVQELSAVTAACFMVKKSDWRRVNNFDEELAVAFNDVDFCLKIRSLGLKIIYNPNVYAYHYESKSRGVDNTKEKMKRFEGEYHLFTYRWNKELRVGDPFYNINYFLDNDIPTINYNRVDFNVKNK